VLKVLLVVVVDVFAVVKTLGITMQFQGLVVVDDFANDLVLVPVKAGLLATLQYVHQDALQSDIAYPVLQQNIHWVLFLIYIRLCISLFSIIF